MKEGERELAPRVAKSLQSWLQVDGGRLLTDRKGRVVWLNDTARALLAESGSIEVTGGVLTSVGNPVSPGFPEFLARLGEKTQTFVAFGPDGDALLLTARTIHSDGRVLCGLKIRTVRDGPLLSGPLLRQVFNLTGAEQTIVLAMMAGETAEIIARTGNQSMETVRTHIKRVYTKLRVNSREALFARLTGFLV